MHGANPSPGGLPLVHLWSSTLRGAVLPSGIPIEAQFPQHVKSSIIFVPRIQHVLVITSPFSPTPQLPQLPQPIISLLSPVSNYIIIAIPFPSPNMSQSPFFSFLYRKILINGLWFGDTTSTPTPARYEPLKILNTTPSPATWHSSQT